MAVVIALLTLFSIATASAGGCILTTLDMVARPVRSAVLGGVLMLIGVVALLSVIILGGSPT